MSKESKSVSHSYKILQKVCLTFEDLHPFVKEEAVPHVPPGSPSANMKGETFVYKNMKGEKFVQSMYHCQGSPSANTKSESLKYVL